MGMLDAFLASATQGIPEGISAYNKSIETQAEEARRRRAAEFEQASKNASLYQSFIKAALDSNDPTRYGAAVAMSIPYRNSLQTMMGNDVDLSKVMPDIKGKLIPGKPAVTQEVPALSNYAPSTLTPQATSLNGYGVSNKMPSMLDPKGILSQSLGSPDNGSSNLPATSLSDYAPQGKIPGMLDPKSVLSQSLGSASVEPDYQLPIVSSVVEPGTPDTYDYTGPDVRKSLEAWTGYVPPEPKFTQTAPGHTTGHWDRIAGKWVTDYVAPDTYRDALLKLRQEDEVRKEAKDRQTADYNNQRLRFIGNRARQLGMTPNMLVKNNIELLRNSQDLASIFGGTITSSGDRPVGNKTDTGATLVDGKQTQWGLYNEYMAGRGAPAAYPGTSKHGNGGAVDVWVPADKAKDFEDAATARGIDLRYEVDARGNAHYHLEAPNGVVPMAKPRTPKPWTKSQEDLSKDMWLKQQGAYDEKSLSPEQKKELYQYLVREKAKWKTEQSGGKDVTQQLLDEMKKQNSSRGAR